MGAVRTLVVASLVWLGLGAVADAGEIRTWVDNRGNQVPGELVDVTADHMVVLLVEGAEVSIPLKVFSANDQTYLRKQMTQQKSEETESVEPVKPTSSEAPPKEKPEDQEPTTELTGADTYHPPVLEESIQYYCTNCDGELSAAIGVGDHCPHCDILIEFEEDEHGNVVEGKRLPWYGRLAARVFAFGVIFVVSTAWKFRHMLPFG